MRPPKANDIFFFGTDVMNEAYVIVIIKGKYHYRPFWLHDAAPKPIPQNQPMFLMGSKLAIQSAGVIMTSEAFIEQ